MVFGDLAWFLNENVNSVSLSFKSKLNETTAPE
jgi:hypothetical protein